MLLMHVQEYQSVWTRQPDKELLSGFNNVHPLQTHLTAQFLITYSPYYTSPFPGKRNSNLCTDANVHTVEMRLSTSNMDG